MGKRVLRGSLGLGEQRGIRRGYLLALGAMIAVISLVAASCVSGLGDQVLARTQMVVEQALGDTPQAEVSAYFGAINRGSPDAALGLWQDSPQLGETFGARRRGTTEELLAWAPSLEFTVQDVEWWRTCCEPGLADPQDAGLARMTVEVMLQQGETCSYTIDVGTVEPYWGRAGGNPVRRWEIWDIYPAGSAPLVFRWPAPTPTPVPEQTLLGTESDIGLWQRYRAEGWSVVFRYPLGWQVRVVPEDGSQGASLQVLAGGRELRLEQRSSVPQDLPADPSAWQIGPLKAHRYVMYDAEGRPLMAMVVPDEPTERFGTATYWLLGEAEDEEYMLLFDLILSSLEFSSRE